MNFNFIKAAGIGASPFAVRNFALISCLGAVMLIAGCHHHHQHSIPARQTAPPPSASTPRPAQSTQALAPRPERIPITPVPAGGVDPSDLDFVNTHQPMQSEVGLATWYTAPYKGRKAANGQVFSDEALTAAHRTLPMGSLITVTNLKTGQSAAMRITDRGPFVDGRILDLTIASAKATGVYRAGTAQVRIDVYQTPKPIEAGGRWCVQIGAFKSEHSALKVKEDLLREYPTSNVIEFPGENSYWVRIRPQGDNREWAEYIARQLRDADIDAEPFLTRLD